MFKRSKRHFPVLKDKFFPKEKKRIYLIKKEEKMTSRSSKDSDLEAFSHSLTDVSFAALAFPPTA